MSVFDRYPGAALDRRRRLARGSDANWRIGSIWSAGTRRKRVMDIPDPLAEAYFAMMPIHEKLRGRDFQTTRNYLRVTLCNIHDELIKRAWTARRWRGH